MVNSILGSHWVVHVSHTSPWLVREDLHLTGSRWRLLSHDISKFSHQNFTDFPPKCHRFKFSRQNCTSFPPKIVRQFFPPKLPQRVFKLPAKIDFHLEDISIGAEEVEDMVTVGPAGREAV